MLKSILSVLAGAFGLVVRVVLIIMLCFLAGFCFFSMLAVHFIWGGVIRIAGIAACLLLIRFILRLGHEDDSPAEDDFRP